ncbi:hypothetical protein BECAL_03036 [Bellilinea caldifistulae]|uniref:Immunity MXAN-0049 protein domain-containing protein n=1 Tax=Bellilinea caldifistulae TaxID=360411 RepID=A0A0N8GM88_9CHLR|nr:DUF1629 domain-containing protein [Bellilinea caldifistulae]KPL74618.1 hypothetical protein AC812_12580 [Bellilinea caldifistulae]GAP11842.1 hypothetical protein BECAL_03036 [Bellilinea caldifistulae]
MSTLAILDYNKLYRLDDPLASRPFRLSDEGYSDWLTKGQAIELFRGRLKLDTPLRLGAYRGGQVTDFLWSGLIPLVCISERVVELLRMNNITGWATYPVEVHGRKGEPLPGYHGFAVTGSECQRDRSRSQILTRQAVPGGEPFQVYRGLYFDEADWDGSDIFLIRNHGIVVTQKVRNLLKKSKVTNVQLIPLVEVEIDVYLDKFEHDK